MGGAALHIIPARFVQAQVTVHGQPHLGRIGIFLAIVLPPADWAKAHCVGNFKRLISTAGAAKTSCDHTLHAFIDEVTRMPVTKM